MSKSSRRAFLGRLGTAAVVPALGSLSSSAFSFSAPAVASAEQGAAPRASYDLLIAGGRVIDPGQNLSAVRDVAILHGRVARIAENIPHTQARSVFDATDKIVTPGLIDLHSHVYEHGTPLGVNSDRVGAFPISRSRAHTHRRHGHPLQTVPSAGLIERPQEKNRVDALR